MDPIQTAWGTVSPDPAVQRVCPFRGCPVTLAPDVAFCARHYGWLGYDQKRRIHEAERKHARGELDMEGVESVWRAVVGEVQGRAGLFGGDR